MLKTSKKILSVILAVVLVVSACGTTVFAAFDASTQTIGFVVTPDKDLTKVENGDEVKFTLTLDVADYSQLFSVMTLAFFYDSSAWSPNGTYTMLGDFAAFFKQGVPTLLANTATQYTDMVNQATTDLSDYDKAFIVAGTVNNTIESKDYPGVMNNANKGFYVTQADGTRSIAELEFTFTVLDNTKNLNIIVPDAFADSAKPTFSRQVFKTTTGSKQSFTMKDAINFELANAMANNPSAPALPIVLTPGAKQIRYAGIDKVGDTPVGTYEGTFDVRVLTSLDLATIFEGEADVETAAKAAATAGTFEIGYVFALGSALGASAFDYATAVATAEAGADNGAYKVKTCNYIQKDGSTYKMSCMVEDMNLTDDSTEVVYALAYAKNGTDVYVIASADMAASTLDVATLLGDYPYYN